MAYVLFFFPGMLFIMYGGAEMAHHAWAIGERAAGGPVYRIKAVIPLTAALLMLQGLSKLMPGPRRHRGGSVNRSYAHRSYAP